MEYGKIPLGHKRFQNSDIVHIGQFFRASKENEHLKLLGALVAGEADDPAARRVAAIMRRARVSAGHAAVVAELIAATTGRGRA